MSLFHDELVQEHRELLEKVRRHALFTEFVNGTIGRERLLLFLSQSYCVADAYCQLLSYLSVYVSEELRHPMIRVAGQLHRNLEEMEELVAGSDLDVRGARLAPPSHALVTFLSSLCHTRPFEEALAACYAKDVAMNRAWLSLTHREAEENSKGIVFKVFAAKHHEQWLETLGGVVDSAHREASVETRQQMADIFPVSIWFLLDSLDGLVSGTDRWERRGSEQSNPGERLTEEPG